MDTEKLPKDVAVDIAKMIVANSIEYVDDCFAGSEDLLTLDQEIQILDEVKRIAARLRKQVEKKGYNTNLWSTREVVKEIAYE